MTKRKIGILGGMGPEATVLMMQRIIAATKAADDCDHVPMIVDNNTQVPSRIDALIHGTGADPGPVLANMAQGLERAGAEALIMPCNTAHHYAAQIKAATPVPFLSMIECSCAQIATEVPVGSKIGILASPAVRLTGLFDRALGELGLRACYLADDSSLLQIIQSVKAQGPSQEALAGLNAAGQALVADGACCLLVACSEFSLQSRDITAAVPVVDSLDVVVAEALRFAEG